MLYFYPPFRHQLQHQAYLPPPPAGNLWSESVAADEPYADDSDEESTYLSELTEEVSGELGDNLTWTLSPDGICTISGTGEWSKNYIIPCEYKNLIKFVIIEENVTSISDYAFENCSSLTSISVDKNNTSYKSIGGILFNINTTELIQYPIGKTASVYSIPDSVTSIDCGAFCSSSLINISIPDSVTEIGGSAFQNCSSLASISIPDSVTEIGGSAFQNCSSLASISIPDSVTEIGYSAFQNCSSLASISVDKNNTSYKSIDGVLFNFYTTRLIQYPIGNTASIYSIPDSIIYIDSFAFQNCSSLASISIPDSVTKIDGYAFSGCSSLTNISVDENNKKYKSIDGVLFDFSGETLIQYPAKKTESSYSVPDSVTYIGNNAFQNCSSLASISIPNSVTQIGGYAFQNCSALSSVNIPDSVTGINDRTFENCSSLASITIPNSVTYISYHAFYACSALTNISVDENNKKYKSIDGVLFDFSGKTLIQYPAGKTESSYSIPDSVTYIGNNAFGGCSALINISVNENNKKYKSIDGVLFDFSGKTLIQYPAGKTELSYSVPDSVTIIDSCAFENCSSLASISIPDSVIQIGESAFENCSSLKEAEIQSKTVYFSNNIFTDTHPDFVIKGYAGSTAEIYAKRNNHKFKPLSEPIPVTPIQTAPEVCGEYSGKLTPKFTADENGNAALSLNLKDSADMKINSYIAYFDSDGNFTGAEILEPDENGDYKFKITDGGYKIMLWDELNPIISAVQQEQK